MSESPEEILLQALTAEAEALRREVRALRAACGLPPDPRPPMPLKATNLADLLRKERAEGALRAAAIVVER